jgi:hypothetical protein
MACKIEYLSGSRERNSRSFGPVKSVEFLGFLGEHFPLRNLCSCIESESKKRSREQGVEAYRVVRC